MYRSSENSTRIIVTGAPGTGKSAIINSLKESGFHCYPEVARQVIQEQQEAGTNLLPWKDVLGFSEKVIDRTESFLTEDHESPICFFDRGLPDTLAYLRVSEIDIHLDIPVRVEKIGYHNKVFYTPFWEDIYINDHERLESPEQAMRIDFHLRSTYTEMGFELIEVPKGEVSDRKEFVIDCLIKEEVLIHV